MPQCSNCHEDIDHVEYCCRCIETGTRGFDDEWETECTDGHEGYEFSCPECGRSVDWESLREAAENEEEAENGTTIETVNIAGRTPPTEEPLTDTDTNTPFVNPGNQVHLRIVDHNYHICPECNEIISPMDYRSINPGAARAPYEDREIIDFHCTYCQTPLHYNIFENTLSIADS